MRHPCARPEQQRAKRSRRNVNNARVIRRGDRTVVSSDCRPLDVDK